MGNIRGTRFVPKEWWYFRHYRKSEGRTTVLKPLLMSRAKQLKIKERKGDFKGKDLPDEQVTVYLERALQVNQGTAKCGICVFELFLKAFLESTSKRCASVLLPPHLSTLSSILFDMS